MPGGYPSKCDELGDVVCAQIVPLNGSLHDLVITVELKLWPTQAYSVDAYVEGAQQAKNRIYDGKDRDRSTPHLRAHAGIVDFTQAHVAYTEVVECVQAGRYDLHISGGKTTLALDRDDRCPYKYPRTA